MKKRIQKAAGTLTLFAFMYLLGTMAGVWSVARHGNGTKETAAVDASMDVERYYAGDISGNILNSENWGLGFGPEGTKPSGNVSAEELEKYNAWYVAPTEEKVIYLTFDAGYENGNTPAILDALKKHSVPATFFLVGNYLETSPDLVKRMVEEGHTVGNHTYHHPDMGSISDQAAFEAELRELEELYEKITGEEMARYYRPPQGKYSENNLKMADGMGYQTFFWSLAYVDWYEDDQPSKEEAFEKLLSRIHPGAIVLLHSTSATNAQILDELLTKWEEMGYRFEALGELSQEASLTLGGYYW